MKERLISQAKKAEQAATQQAEKAAKGLQGIQISGDGGTLDDDSNEELDPAQYFENRVKAIEAKKAKGVNPYPHKFHVSTSLPDFVQKFQDLEPGQQMTDVTISLAGEHHDHVVVGLCQYLVASHLGYESVGLRWCITYTYRLFLSHLTAVTGRIYSKRASGAKLLFYDLKAEGSKVQIMADAR